MSIVNVKKQKNYYSFEWVVNKDVRLRFRYAMGILCPMMAENKHYKNKFNPKRWVNAFKVSEDLMREIAYHCQERFSVLPIWKTAGNRWVDQQWAEAFYEQDLAEGRVLARIDMAKTSQN